ncbi:MAG: hypothetical protein QM758_00045 [Armatimonas sp.]
MKLAKLVDWIIPAILILISGFVAVVMYIGTSFGNTAYALHSIRISSSERVIILQEMPVLSRANEWFVFIEQGGKPKWIYAACSDTGRRIKQISWNKKTQFVGIDSDSGWQIGYDFSRNRLISSPGDVKAAFRNSGEELFPVPESYTSTVKDISPAEAEAWLSLAPKNATHNFH